MSLSKESGSASEEEGSKISNTKKNSSLRELGETVVARTASPCKQTLIAATPAEECHAPRRKFSREG